MADSIKVGPGMQAFAAGMVAGDVADDVASGAEEAPIRDISGKRIGSFTINEA